MVACRNATATAPVLEDEEKDMTVSVGTWLITGAARGLGFEMAREVLRRGGRVAAAVRNPDMAIDALRGAASGLDRLFVIPINLEDASSVNSAVERASAHFGGLDVLVNNAGYGLLGAVEEAADDEVEAVFRVNVFGPHRLIRAALPVLRKSAAARIVNISSLGGFAASAGWGIYNATKFALEGLSEALAIEGASFGLRVVIVEPGAFRTGFLTASSMRRARRMIDQYAATAGRTRTVAEQRNGQQRGDPVAAAGVIVNAVLLAEPPLRLVLGADAIERVETKLESVRRDVEAWRAQSTSTSYPT
jgi:NAD(P)-dependent dehydrogenase (short-subunit alcohol dehydrogenase family)